MWILANQLPQPASGLLPLPSLPAPRDACDLRRAKHCAVDFPLLGQLAKTREVPETAPLRWCIGWFCLYCNAYLYKISWKAFSAGRNKLRLKEAISLCSCSSSISVAKQPLFLPPSRLQIRVVFCYLLHTQMAGTSRTPLHLCLGKHIRLCDLTLIFPMTWCFKRRPESQDVFQIKELNHASVSARVIGAGSGLKKICSWLGIQPSPAVSINTSQHSINHSVLFKILLMVKKQMV